MLVSFLEWLLGTAGYGDDVGEIQTKIDSTICCVEKYPKGFRRWVRSRGVTGDQEGVLALPGVARVNENLAAEVRTPTSDFVAAWRRFRSGSGGEWKGAQGLLIDK
jgi:hypothetical protein